MMTVMVKDGCDDEDGSVVLMPRIPPNITQGVRGISRESMSCSVKQGWETSNTQGRPTSSLKSVPPLPCPLRECLLRGKVTCVGRSTLILRFDEGVDFRARSHFLT